MTRYDPNQSDPDSYRHLTVRAVDPGKVELVAQEDFRWEGHHVAVTLQVKEWPNDSIHFHDAAHIYVLVFNAVRSLCEGHVCGSTYADPNDIPF